MPAVYGGESTFTSLTTNSLIPFPFPFSPKTVVSFFSYRFFRSYTYYSVAVVAYEALVVSSVQFPSSNIVETDPCSRVRIE